MTKYTVYIVPIILQVNFKNFFNKMHAIFKNCNIAKMQKTQIVMQLFMQKALNNVSKLYKSQKTQQH